VVGFMTDINKGRPGYLKDYNRRTYCLLQLLYLIGIKSAEEAVSDSLYIGGFQLTPTELFAKRQLALRSLDLFTKELVRPHGNNKS
jgi:hypothetical protein